MFNCWLSFLVLCGGKCFSVDFRGFDVEWCGRGSVCVSDNGFSVAVDPFPAGRGFEADIVLVTCEAEGYSDEVLDEVRKERTVFVFPESFDGGVSFRDTEFLEVGEAIDVYGVEIEAVPLEKEGSSDSGGVGYRFSMKDTSFYVAGNTGLFEGVRDLENRVDLAFLPVEEGMEVEDAVRAAVRVKPDLAVPYFFRSMRDAKKFMAELEDRSIDCRILENGLEAETEE